MRVTKKQQQTIVQAHARNFETLRSAFLLGFKEDEEAVGKWFPACREWKGER